MGGSTGPPMPVRAEGNRVRWRVFGRSGRQTGGRVQLLFGKRLEEVDRHREDDGRVLLR